MTDYRLDKTRVRGTLWANPHACTVCAKHTLGLAPVTPSSDWLVVFLVICHGFCFRLSDCTVRPSNQEGKILKMESTLKMTLN